MSTTGAGTSPLKSGSERGFGKRLKRGRKEDSERGEELKQRSAITVVSAVLAIPALLALVIYALPGGGKVLAVGLLTAVSAFAAGALVGFLFGIPRTRVGAQSDEATNSLYAPNTNLEQISDWLTKILVGVGLVQIGQLGGAVNNLADGLESGLGKYGHSVAIMLLVSFAVAGFMSSYLFTRLRLQRDFEPFRKALKQQEDSLTNALPLVRAQLDPSGELDPTPIELSAALHDASSGIRDEAFYLARNQRRANWRGKRGGGEKRLVELVIPVFEALISLDDERVWHRNYAELAYALKDKKDPSPADFERARANLTTAISIRAKSASGDAVRFPMYEFNRAYCNIALDPAPAMKRQSDEPLVDEICADLESALGTATGQTAIKRTKAVRNWLQRNASDPRVAALLARIGDAR